MAIPGIQEIQALATKYSKPQLQKMAQMGLVDPTKAVMAGMMIDRIQQQNMQPPQQTVAEEVMGGPPPMPEGAPAGPPPDAAGGVAALPSGLPEEMAGGGIVAFADGGYVPGYADQGLVDAAAVANRSGMAQGQANQPASSGLEALAFPGGMKYREYGALPTPSLKDEFGALQAAEKEVGIDDAALFAQMREEEKQRRKDLEGRKNQAFGDSLIMAGFGLLGARRGEEFEVLSTVGRQAVMQYGAAMKDIRDTERDISKSERQLLLAENQLKREKSGKAQDRYDSKLKEVRDREIKSVDQYNEAIKKIAELNMEKFKVDKKAATDMAVAQLQRQTQLETNAMPGAEQRLLMAIHADPALADTYKSMKITSTKEDARAKFALELEKEWNNMSIIEKNKLLTDNPNMTSDDYIKAKMKFFDTYWGKKQAGGSGEGGGVVVSTPQGDIRFNSQADADAFKKKLGLK
jgi:hypothetical protein